MLLGLNFVMLHVPDIQKARAFYTEKLGFVVEDEQPTFVQFKQKCWHFCPQRRPAAASRLQPDNRQRWV